MKAEEWLNGNCEMDDWSKGEESLNDSLWTNNVIKYMDAYSKEKNVDLINALKDIMNQYEGDGMECMGNRDDVIYKICKDSISKIK